MYVYFHGCVEDFKRVLQNQTHGGYFQVETSIGRKHLLSAKLVYYSFVQIETKTRVNFHCFVKDESAAKTYTSTVNVFVRLK